MRFSMADERSQREIEYIHVEVPAFLVERSVWEEIEARGLAETLKVAYVREANLAFQGLGAVCAILEEAGFRLRAQVIDEREIPERAVLRRLLPGEINDPNDPSSQDNQTELI
jgi:hypothetical protein